MAPNVFFCYTEYGTSRNEYHAWTESCSCPPSKNENDLLIMYQKKAGEIASWDLNVELFAIMGEKSKSFAMCTVFTW